MAKGKRHEKRVESKPDRDWFDARRRELGKSVSETARFMGYNIDNMVWRVISGARSVRPVEMVKWAEFLQVPFLEIARRFGLKIPPLTVPVIGAIRSHGRVSLYPPNMQTQTEAPAETMLAPMVALVVAAPASALAIWNGNHLFYEPSDVVKPDAYGRLSIIEVDIHGEAPLLGYLDRGSKGRAKVTIFGTQEQIDAPRITSATPIRWQSFG